LPGGTELRAGLRQQRILRADERGGANDGGELRHAAWRMRRRDSIDRGSVPSQHVRTATEVASVVGEAHWQKRLAGEVAPTTGKATSVGRIAIERTSVSRDGRPRGKRFGILVHAVLAEVDLGAGASEAAEMAEVQGRLLGATLAEVASAKDAVISALAHPLLQRAAAAWKRGECRRETPVVMPLPDGAVLDGVIDLAFREASPEGPVWLIIDFKTDADVELHGAAYEVQVGLYVDAVERATGEKAKGVLLSV
jgi:ATP-dependent exoDNAse (exonuclease V) beta subunit